MDSSFFFLLDYGAIQLAHLGLPLGFLSFQVRSNSALGDTKVFPTKQRWHADSLFALGLEIFDAGRCPLSHDQAVKTLASVTSADIRWREQQKGQKHDKKTVVQGRSRRHCEEAACVRIVRRAQELSLSDDHPICVCTDTGSASGEIRFLTATDISECLQLLPGKVYKLTKPDDLAWFTSHSVRVGACVAFHAAGLSKEATKRSLRWRSNTFWGYLPNLPGQALPCAEAMVKFDPRILDMDF